MVNFRRNTIVSSTVVFCLVVAGGCFSDVSLAEKVIDGKETLVVLEAGESGTISCVAGEEKVQLASSVANGKVVFSPSSISGRDGKIPCSADFMKDEYKKITEAGDKKTVGAENYIIIARVKCSSTPSNVVEIFCKSGATALSPLMQIIGLIIVAATLFTASS